MNNVDSIESLRELALFAGAGGGILGGHLLGWRTVCAVEVEPYAAAVLAQRQNDGLLPAFPIWDDVRTFDGRPWRGKIDIISGGFPCQDISIAGKGAGIDGERSGLWREFARIIGEVRPRFAFVENSPMLVRRGLTRVLADLAELGYDAVWTIIGADDVGAPHRRKRLWLLAEYRDISHADVERRESLKNKVGVAPEAIREEPARQLSRADCNVPDASHQGNVRRDGQLRADEEAARTRSADRRGTPEDDGGEWWSTEPGLGRVADGVPNRVDRLKGIGNAQVPLVAAVAFRRLKQILTITH